MWRVASATVLLCSVATAMRPRGDSFLVQPGAVNEAVTRQAVPTPEPVLLPPAIWALPTGAVRPLGWLDTQLRIQSSGLAGHLSRLYADIANSTWFGGDATENGGLRERAPYWLNGAVPMAYLLPGSPASPRSNTPAQSHAEAAARTCPARPGDSPEAVQFAAHGVSRSEARHAVISSGGSGSPRLCGGLGSDESAFNLRDEVARLLNIVLDMQAPSGWLGGPANDSPADRDQYWVAWDVLYALMGWAEAEPAQRDRVRVALLAYSAEASRRLDAAPMDGWSSLRWPEWVAITHRILDTFSSDLSPEERSMLLDLCSQIEDQGYDWRGYFTNPAALPNLNASSLPFAPAWTLTEHGVNHAMALKEGAVRWRSGGGDDAVALSRLKVALLDAAHGQPTGVFSADECLGGREPNRGTELCTIVEAAHSLGLLHRTHGDIAFADRAERIIYNSLPGAVSEDAWAHNYLSQANEIFAGHTDPHTWRTDPPDSTVYGFAPTYGCCTANFIQGWPKHTLGMIGYAISAGPFGTRAKVVVSMYGPVEATMPAGVGGGCHVTMSTDYPFADDVLLTIDGSQPVGVDLRIPGWTGTTATVRVNNREPRLAQGGAFYTAQCPAGVCTIALSFQFVTNVVPGWGGVAVARGPLLFALPLDEQWTKVRQYDAGAADWEVRAGDTAPWNRALRLVMTAQPGNATLLEHAFVLQRRAEADVLQGAEDRALHGLNTEPAFTRASPRVWLTAQARVVPDWTSKDGGHTADSPPPSPACGVAGDKCGPLQDVRLVPFGNTRLRISVFPYTLA
jgi:hypothetical protein